MVWDEHERAEARYYAMKVNRDRVARGEPPSFDEEAFVRYVRGRKRLFFGGFVTFIRWIRHR